MEFLKPKLPCNSNVDISTPLISGYNFEFVATPLASGGVALFINEKHNYRVLEKTSNTAFQALWIEISPVKKESVICGIIYRQHNSPEGFQQYFDKSIEKYTALDKEMCILGDFNIDLLKAQSSNYSQDFLMSLQSCYLIPTVVKPTRVRSTSATLIDIIFVNTPEKVLVSGNIISDISDHFSQFCILTSIVNQTKVESRKVRDFSKFSPGSFTADISQVDWNEILDRDNANVDRTFSFFYNKFNKILNKHALFKTFSKRRIKQLSKPWITKGIQTAVKIKINLYMSGNDARYKYYRNEISKLTRISKKLYYHEFFNKNLNNLKKTWEGIKGLLSRKKKTYMTINNLKQPHTKTITDLKSRIPNILNEHFTSIGPSLANKLPLFEKHFIEYLEKKKSPITSFFFTPITSKVIKLEILSMLKEIEILFIF